MWERARCSHKLKRVSKLVEFDDRFFILFYFLICCWMFFVTTYFRNRVNVGMPLRRWFIQLWSQQFNSKKSKSDKQTNRNRQKNPRKRGREWYATKTWKEIHGKCIELSEKIWSEVPARNSQQRLYYSENALKSWIRKFCLVYSDGLTLFFEKFLLLFGNLR